MNLLAEPSIQPSPEMAPQEKIAHILRSALQIGQQKARLSPITNGRSLSDISQELRLAQIIPNPEALLVSEGINIIPGTPVFRKAEILTMMTAASLSRIPNPDATKAAAILLSTNYAPQMDLKALIRTARLQDNAEGAKADRRLIGDRGGAAILRQVETGKIDRLLASSIAVIAEQHNLPLDTTLEIARIITLNQAPSRPDVMVYVHNSQMVYEVAKALMHTFPRTTLKPDDVPFHRLSRIALQAVDQAKLLANPTERRKAIARIAEYGKIPDKVESLQDVVRIVDENPEIQAVSFDLYDTLVQWTEDFVDRYGRYPKRAYKHLRSVGVNISEEQFRQINDVVWRDRWEKYQAHGNEIPLQQTIDDLINRITAGKVLNPQERGNLHHLLSREWYSLELENAVAMPGAKETLEALKHRGIKICLTSNASWSMQHIHRVLNRFGLLEYFDVMTISSEIGRMKKPHITDLFHHSWNKLKIPYHAVLHVGDNANDDVAGARNAGAKSILYNNPLAYNRLEVDKVHGGLRFMRDTDAQLYAETVVHMQKQSLEAGADEWISAEMRKRNIPEAERQRVLKLAKDVYTRTRDIYAPVYINLSDHLLRQLETGQADTVLALARDGLPMAVAMKLMLNLDSDRYPRVRSNQIHYVYASRDILRKAAHPTSPAEEDFKRRYIKYLEQIESFRGKRVLLTDIGSSGLPTSNHVQLKEILLNMLGVTEANGLYLDGVPGSDRHMFLQEALGINEVILEVDTPLIQIESLFSGPKEASQDFVETSSGSMVRPVVTPKSLPPEVLVRGLSEQSLLFFNHVATKGLMDSIRIRHRARLAGLPDPADREVVLRFVNYIKNIPKDDLLLSTPWRDKGIWMLPRNNPLIAKAFNN